METLGRYQILRELGHGAFGVVYSAMDPRIGRKVAIKTIHANVDHSSGEPFRERLRREAHTAGILSHPHIVTIYELDEVDKITYIAMEFVDGQTLAAILEKGELLPLEILLTVTQQTADALDFAHSRGVVHRDVKPANIMVTDEGQVKVADFGIAKVLDHDASLTNTGVIIGTAHYMSPEHVSGGKVGGRSDQFALGVIAYEMLTGNRPFQGPSWVSIFQQIVSAEPPPVKQYRSDLDDSVTSVLRRALAKDQTERYETCREFADELSNAVFNMTVRLPATDAMANSPTRAMVAPEPSELVPQAAGDATVNSTLAAPAQTTKSGTAAKKLVPIALAAAAAIVLAGGWLVLRPGATKPPVESSAEPKTGELQRQVQTQQVQTQQTQKEPVQQRQPQSQQARTQTVPPGATTLQPNPAPSTPGPTATADSTKQQSPKAPNVGAAAVIGATAVNGLRPVEESGPPPNLDRRPEAAAANVDVRRPVIEESKAARPPAEVSTPAQQVIVNPQAADAAAWERIRDTADIAVLEDFRSKFPTSSMAPEAARQIERLDWQRVAQTRDPGVLRSFLSKYPAGPHVAEARAELANIERRAEADASRRLVDETVRRYQAAFESRNIDALKAVWPSLTRAEVGSFQNFFRTARTLKLVLTPLAEPEMTADTATVRSRRVVTAADERGSLPPQDQTVMIRLRKSGASMVIESIQTVSP